MTKEQEDHAITRKANNALKKKYCDLDKKHKELELQYGILWDSNSHLPKTKKTSTSSTIQGCGKYFNLDLNAYYTNLANMDAMRKKIARLNEIIRKGGWVRPNLMTRRKMNQKGHNSSKEGIPQSSMGLDTQKEPRHERRIVNGYECVQFERKGKIGIEQSAHTTTV